MQKYNNVKRKIDFFIFFSKSQESTKKIVKLITIFYKSTVPSGYHFSDSNNFKLVWFQFLVNQILLAKSK